MQWAETTIKAAGFTPVDEGLALAEGERVYRCRRGFRCRVCHNARDAFDLAWFLNGFGPFCTHCFNRGRGKAGTANG